MFKIFVGAVIILCLFICIIIVQDQSLKWAAFLFCV